MRPRVEVFFFFKFCRTEIISYREGVTVSQLTLQRIRDSPVPPHVYGSGCVNAQTRSTLLSVYTRRARTGGFGERSSVAVAKAL